MQTPADRVVDVAAVQADVAQQVVVEAAEMRGGAAQVAPSQPCPPKCAEVGTTLLVADRGSEMRRADRPFEIIQLVRRKPPVRACDLADALDVSECTVYRDVLDLMASDVPIEGEAGRLRPRRPAPGRARPHEGGLRL